MSEAGLDQGVAGAPTSGESDASSDKRVSAGALSESDESLDTVDDDIDKMLSELQDFQEVCTTGFDRNCYYHYDNAGNETRNRLQNCWDIFRSWANGKFKKTMACWQALL